MTKINNSYELLAMIKNVSRNHNNWEDEDTMILRLAFGAMQMDDEVCTHGDFKSHGILDDDEMIFSQENKNDARDKFDSKVDGINIKQGPSIFPTLFIVCTMIQKVHYSMDFCMK